MGKYDHTYGFIDDKLICRQGGSSQAVVRFEPVVRLTEHHDELLADLTEKLNELILTHEATSPRDDGRELAMIKSPNGWMLAYTHNQWDRDWEEERRAGVVLELDGGDHDKLRELLGLRH